ncbi:MAG: hypothetical protein ACRD8Z_15620, partial [Nitrososphaeraceae archaeon]
CGYYVKPLATITKDELGNAIDSKIQGQKGMFHIPFTPENVRAIIDEHGGEYKGLALATAVQGYAEKFYGSFKYKVYNLEEFIHSKFEDCLGANQGGFLKNKVGRVVEEGGVEKFIMDKAAKKEQAEREFKEFKQKQKESKK